jgi:hypothetical protein
MMTRPHRHEAAEYYFKYIDQVPDGDVCDQLERYGQGGAAARCGEERDG